MVCVCNNSAHMHMYVVLYISFVFRIYILCVCSMWLFLTTGALLKMKRCVRFDKECIGLNHRGSSSHVSKW